MLALMNRWTFPRFQTEERVLVLGLGGSLDVVSAFAVAQAILISSPATVLYGGADLNADTTDWKHIAGYTDTGQSAGKTKHKGRTRTHTHIHTHTHTHTHTHKRRARDAS